MPHPLTRLPRRLPPPPLLPLCAVQNGHIKRVTDEDIQSSVLEIISTNVSTTYITCPADPAKTLGIKLPFLVMIVKNLNKYFTFEVQVLDDKNVRRRFRASNYQVRGGLEVRAVGVWGACWLAGEGGLVKAPVTGDLRLAFGNGKGGEVPRLGRSALPAEPGVR